MLLVLSMVCGVLVGGGCAAWSALAGTEVVYTGPQGASIRVVLPPAGSSSTAMIARSAAVQLDGGEPDAGERVIGLLVVDCPASCRAPDGGTFDTDGGGR